VSLKRANNLLLFVERQNLIMDEYNFEIYIMKADHILSGLFVFHEKDSITRTNKSKHVKNYAKHE